MSLYRIASLKHTSADHEHIVWWGRMECGYTPVVGDYCGAYVYGYAVDLNDGRDCLAVPVSVVEQLLSPEPYHMPGRRFYDQRGPVVQNTRGNWNKLIAGSLEFGRQFNPKPVAFRGVRRAIFTESNK